MQLKVSKSTLSMYLRTKCDKSLFLSLHDKATMAKAGLPAPIKRPGIGILSVQGKEFEVERNDVLIKHFPTIVKFLKKRGGGYDVIDLNDALIKLTECPALLLQAHFSISANQASVLNNIGIAASDVPFIPIIASFIPDVIHVRPSLIGELEVLPNGTRIQVDASEKRMALSIWDVKHTAEANPSYCAEIAMYALMLSNWLKLSPILSKRYYVSANSYLWTRHKQGRSNLDAAVHAGMSNPLQLLDSLILDLEDAQLRFYLSAIRGFFENVARVVRIGSAQSDGWEKLEWHITGSCSSCDWLGDKRHMGREQKDVLDRNPHHYCIPLADKTGHLSLVPGVTRGAKKVLQLNTVKDIAALAGATGHPALQQHTLLKREAKTLPIRSTAISTGHLARDSSATIASLVPSANLLLYASVNFDSSSGLLTGLALSGVATNFTKGESPRRFKPVPFIVDQKELHAEWIALEGFLSQIANCIDIAEKLVSGSVTGQIHFWEKRQFEELCNALGRHLPQVMALTNRKAKALAWIFPPDEMIARAESLEAATVVAIDEIIQRMVFAPTRHVITLFDTVEHYRVGTYSPASGIDSYYREYFSNGIPRERIYELWSNADPIKRGSDNLPRNTIISQYSDALEKQSQSLEAVSEKLRQDFLGQFRAKATHIPTSIPQGARNVAFDAKLWQWWDNLEFNASQIEAHIRLAMDGERLESSYEAIVLKNGVHVGSDIYDFDVGAGSTEAKFKEDSMLTLGKIGHPGLPLQYASKLLRAGASPYRGNQDILTRPIWSILNAKIIEFDRVNRRARIQLFARNEPLFFPYLISNSKFQLLDDVFLTESKKPKGFNWAEHCGPILEAIGTPRIATPDSNAAKAMGITPARRAGAVSTDTPAAQVLWNAPALEQKILLPAAIALSMASHVGNANNLNDSQKSAVAHALERSLTLIWGPPGTGKTKTLASILHAISLHSLKANKAINILVAGPTYKAVEDVMNRAASAISADSTAPVDFYMGYSQGRPVAAPPEKLAAHVSYHAMFFDRTDSNMLNCIAGLTGGNSVTIVGCQVRQARQFPKYVSGNSLHPIFDVVIIDESSQVPVSHAISPFAGLKNDFRLIIAGDHLQMPPISSIEAPSNAAYLVGSIQTYLTSRPHSVPKDSWCALEKNYRSADSIVAFAKRIGYKSSLQAEYGHARLHFMQPLPDKNSYPKGLPWSDDFIKLLHPDAVAVTLLHEDATSSQGNPFEAKLVAGIVWMLRQSVSGELDSWGGKPPSHGTLSPERFWSSCIGIVTPHRAQRALVMRELQRLFPAEINLISGAVDTVERFQGAERHTIIVTFGVADVDVISGEEAFIMQMERINVAVSRAMAKCIVVMPDALSSHIPEEKKALQTAHALKDYVEEFCNYRTKTHFTDSSDSRRGEIRYHV